MLRVTRAAWSLLAATAVKDYLAAQGIQGRVRYYGCPAEEGGAAKGFMVRADSGIASLEDVANANICVLQGTTTLLNLNAVLGDLEALFKK